ncbi:CaiB/BaiF CoA transferase family protein [Aeromicrobium duanguangcaii]|uniref:CaiB/BaiF CoA transferase family protein n=1 Tax=Aeromicrobium duanguangcaii TaxID=2968086 RepID=UPI00201708EC|nr:CoA transferase [Aeromicrobium duanguangcaii]MCL3837614.1 CoA transferase [Aeromicrobium duanguangcaii]
MSTPSALPGIRVLELTHAIAGPHTGQILADHGADVIKVEPPGGELARGAMPMSDGDSTYFAAQNRGKRSVVLDLKDPDDLAVLLRLAEGSDVVLTNYSVDVPDRLGWGFEALKAANPSIIMVHITGFGSTGADRALLAFDGIIQGLSGIPQMTGLPDGDPMFIGTFVADHLTAYRAAMAVMMALRVRDASPEAQFVDVNMMTSYMGLLAHDIHESLEGRPYMRAGNRVPVSIANTYAARDGFVHLAPVGPVKWERFCRAVGRPDWAECLSYDKAVLTARDEVDEYLEQWCRDRERADILTLMRDLSIPCGPVRELSEAVRHLDERGDDSVVRVTSPAGRTVAVPGPLTSVGLGDGPRRLRVPAVGEHDDEVLGEIRARLRDSPPPTT